MAAPYEPTAAALTAIKELIQETFAPGQEHWAGLPKPLVVLWPEEYETVRRISADDLPIVIIGEAVGIPTRPEGAAAMGKARFHWTVEIVILLSKGALTYPDTESAAAEMKLWYWRAALWNLFYANKTLKGTVELVGSTRDNEYVLFEATSQPWQWNQEPYFGWVIHMPVRQAIAISPGY